MRSPTEPLRAKKIQYSSNHGAASFFFAPGYGAAHQSKRRKQPFHSNHLTTMAFLQRLPRSSRFDGNYKESCNEMPDCDEAWLDEKVVAAPSAAKKQNKKRKHAPTAVAKKETTAAAVTPPVAKKKQTSKPKAPREGPPNLPSLRTSSLARYPLRTFAILGMTRPVFNGPNQRRFPSRMFSSKTCFSVQSRGSQLLPPTSLWM